jgi:hypothetical protein
MLNAKANKDSEINIKASAEDPFNKLFEALEKWVIRLDISQIKSTHFQTALEFASDLISGKK